MEDSITPAVTDAVRHAGRDAQRLGKDVKRDLTDLMSSGREAVGQVASEAQGAMEDLTARGRSAAQRSREYLQDGRETASRVGQRVTDYADRNTALVAATSFGVGLLIGWLGTRRGH